MNLPIIKKKNFFLGLSSLMVVASIVAYLSFGLNFGIDFTGGSIMELKFNGSTPDVALIRSELSGLNLKSVTVQPTDQNGVIIRFQDTESSKYQEILDKLNQLAGANTETTDSQITIESDQNVPIEIQTDNLATGVEELRFESVGPSIGKELRRNALISLIIVAILIIGFVAWTFRKVSRPVASWKYGLAGVIALTHDILIVIGIFSVLGHFYNIEINTPFVTAILMVFGYSINDTIVVFDRIRENLPKSDANFEETVNTSINQTLIRSMFTSATTLMTLLAIIIYGGESIRYFALALFTGVFFGTYSSIFLASPLLVQFHKMKK